MERDKDSESERFLRLAQANFGEIPSRQGDEGVIDGSQLPDKERVIDVDGKRMRAVDLGSKKLRGRLTAANIRSKPIVWGR